MTYIYYNAAFKTGKWQERTKDNIRVMSKTSVSMFYMAIKLITDKITVFWSHSANVCMCKSHYIPKTKYINPPTPKSSLFMTSEWLFVLFVWFIWINPINQGTQTMYSKSQHTAEYWRKTQTSVPHHWT